MERKASTQIRVKKRVKRYQQKKTGKWVKGYTKTIHKYPRKYRTFRTINGVVRFVEITRVGTTEQIKILDSKHLDLSTGHYSGTLYIEQPSNLKQSVPYTKFMKKYLYNREIQAFEKLSQDYKERSFAVDFERYLVHPERYAITKGGYNRTMKIGDFELFGHSHPYESKDQRLPSAADLRNMNTFSPEFIISYPQYARNPESESEIYFFNIEDLQKYDIWKERYKDAGKNAGSINDLEIASEVAKLVVKEKDPKKIAELKQITEATLFDTDLGRQIFFEKTGVKIYPYDKSMVNVNIELPDYPRETYAVIPGTSTENLKEWQAHLKPYMNKEKTREAIDRERKELKERIYPFSKKEITLDDQLNESQWMLSYLREKQKEGIMNQEEIEKETEKEVEHYREIVHKLEDQMIKNPSLIVLPPEQQKKETKQEWTLKELETIHHDVNAIMKTRGLKTKKERREIRAKVESEFTAKSISLLEKRMGDPNLSESKKEELKEKKRILEHHLTTLINDPSLVGSPEPKPKRSYTTKADKTQNAIHKKYNLIAMSYMGVSKMTPDDRIDKLKLELEALEQLQKDPKLDKKVLDNELKKVRQELKMEAHYGMGSPTLQEYESVKKGSPPIKRDQTVRWMGLTSEQLKNELNDTTKYPDTESIKRASETLLTKNEMKLKIRERIITIIIKKMAEDRAIAHLGR